MSYCAASTDVGQYVFILFTFEGCKWSMGGKLNLPVREVTQPGSLKVTVNVLFLLKKSSV